MWIKAKYSSGSLNVGVIGQTPFTSALNVSALHFKAYKKITIDESVKLRRAGADIVLLACHVGMFCTTGLRLAKLMLRNKDTNQGNTCNLADELHAFIYKLPRESLTRFWEDTPTQLFIIG